MQHFISSRSYMKDEFLFWIMRAVQQSISEHGHDFVELVYVVSGEGIHTFGGSRYAISAGDVFLINPGETHAYEVAPGEQMEIVNCLFMPSFISDTLLRQAEIAGSMDFFYVHPFLNDEARFGKRLNVQGEEAATVLALLESMIKENNMQRSGYRTMIRLQLVELLIVLSRYYASGGAVKQRASSRQTEKEMTALRIYGYLERNYDQKISLQQLAAMYHVSVRHLNRIVRTAFGKSVIEMLHEIRIGRAKHLLAETDEKVIAIATMVGYEDPAFFSRLFHRYEGIAPSQYRGGLVR